MQILRCGSDAANVRELVSLSESAGLPALFLSVSAASKMTGAEIEFAFYLAEESFKSNGNLSGKKTNEALLFLACETNFSSAARKIGAADPSDFVLALKEKVSPKKLQKALKLVRAEEMRLPKWGKKKGDYTQGELAIEQMALARVRN